MMGRFDSDLSGLISVGFLRTLVESIANQELPEKVKNVGAMKHWSLDKDCDEVRAWFDTSLGKVAVEYDSAYIVKLASKHATTGAIVEEIMDTLRKSIKESYQKMLEEAQR